MCPDSLKRNLIYDTETIMTRITISSALLLTLLVATGCRVDGVQADRPFPLGQVTDAHWETQQTNAEAADFIFYDHEFVGDTEKLAPGGKKHIEQVALRMEHTPFPIVIEESIHGDRVELDAARRRTIIESLARMGVVDVEDRIVVASAFPEGITAIEGERAYTRSLSNSRNNGGFGGRRGSMSGGFYR